MKPDYTKLDSMILAAIGDTPRSFVAVFVGEIRRECMEITTATGKGGDSFRVLDRRIQALRKRGLIEWTTKGWIRVKAA